MKLSTGLSLTLLTLTSSFQLHGLASESKDVRSLINNVYSTVVSKRDVVNNEARSLPKSRGNGGSGFSNLMASLWKNDLKMSWLNGNKKSIEGGKNIKKLSGETKIKMLLTLLASEISENRNDSKIKKLFALKSKSQATAKNATAVVANSTAPAITQNQVDKQPQQVATPLTATKSDLTKQVPQIQQIQVPQAQQALQVQQAQPIQNNLNVVPNKVRSEIPTTTITETKPKSKKLTAFRKIKLLLTLVASEFADLKVQAKLNKFLDEQKTLKIAELKSKIEEKYSH